jgi:hypothetical protein
MVPTHAIIGWPTGQFGATKGASINKYIQNQPIAAKGGLYIVIARTAILC